MTICAAEWATAGGDLWAERWSNTDSGLAGLAPHLLSTVVGRAPKRAFRAFEVGCGAGSTAIAVAAACPAAAIIACDISPALVRVARQRTADLCQIRVVIGDAQDLAVSEGPFELIFSRHGVMFFSDPKLAFHYLRRGARLGASLIFSCFHNWASNPWASELACAVVDKAIPAPGREPNGFAFADPDYVLEILSSSGGRRQSREP